MMFKLHSVLLVLLLTPVSVWAQTQICVPQFADGFAGAYRWQTILILHNQSQSMAQIQVQFYGRMGQSFMMNRRGSGGQWQFGPNGLFSPTPLNPGAMVGYRSGGQNPLQSGFCIIDSSARIQTQVMFHLYDGFGTLLSETGVMPSGAFTSGTFYVDHTENARVGLAFANPLTVTANVTLEIFAEDGTTALSSTQMQLGPRTHFSQFVDEIFPNSLPASVGYVRISSSTSICAMALRIKTTTISPVAFFVNQ